jgi:hypothetical protein
MPLAIRVASRIGFESSKVMHKTRRPMASQYSVSSRYAFIFVVDAVALFAQSCELSARVMLRGWDSICVGSPRKRRIASDSRALARC